MPCPDLYFNFRNAPTAPPDPFWRNQAINPSWPATPTPELTEGVPVTIPVQLQNRGDEAPPTRLRLFWSIPSTGFLADPAKIIGSVDLASVAPHTDIPPEDGLAIHNFAWTPPAEAGGHVCLRADAQMLAAPNDGCPQQTFGTVVQSDPRIAIRNIHVVEAVAPKMAQGFAFAASNNLRHIADTKLIIRQLDPHDNREELLRLVSDRSLRARLGRGVTFAKPTELLFALGRERRRTRLGKDAAVVRGSVDFERIGHLREDELPSVVDPRDSFVTVKNSAAELHLLPGELQQVVIAVPPSPQSGVANVVDIEHVAADGKMIGGLTIVFVSPPDYFGGC